MTKVNSFLFCMSLEVGAKIIGIFYVLISLAFTIGAVIYLAAEAYFAFAEVEIILHIKPTHELTKSDGIISGEINEK